MYMFFALYFVILILPLWEREIDYPPCTKKDRDQFIGVINHPPVHH